VRFQTLEQWLDWQSGLHPSEIELGLERVARVWRRLCPEGLPSSVITVAGTNGKGSSVAMLEAVYRQAGFRIGTYTSPHLVRYNERIRLDGAEVEDEALCHAFEAVDQARGATTLTYFEFGTLTALYLFSRQELDLVLLEVGLGGRLDAVNIIDADLALITTIDIDHAEWLGHTRDAIGREKAGIMRCGRPTVLGDPDMPDSVLEYAQQIGAQVVVAGRDFSFTQLNDCWQWSGPSDRLKNLPIPGITGAGYLQNAAAVVMVCECLRPSLPVNDEDLAAGLSAVRLAGRRQWVAGKPELLLDVAHNRQAVAGLLETLRREVGGRRVLAVCGLLSDKDAAAIGELLREHIDQWHLMDLPGSRGRSAQALATALQAAGVDRPIHAWPDFSCAFENAKQAAHEEDLILVFGSFVVVGEAMHYLGIG
jgi:dihydrofolate synthase/folylpolyglutamate synthase